MQKKLNFGCGLQIREGYVNADIQKAKGIDLSFDFDKTPYPIKDNTFDYILVDNVLEHLKYPHKVIDELCRISKPCGRIKIIVPYCRSILAYNDVLHVNFFNKVSMNYLLNGYSGYDNNHKVNKPKFISTDIKLRPTFYGRLLPKFLRKYADYLFNEIHDLIIVDCIVGEKK